MTDCKIKPENYPHVHEYIANWRYVRSLAPDTRGKGWDGLTRTAGEERASYLKALHNRINVRDDVKPRGRKDDPDYFWACQRDKHRLEAIARRVRVYQFETDECRRRFGDRLADPKEI